MVTCSCGQVSVGKTDTPLKERFYTHRSDKKAPLRIHQKLCKEEGYSVTILENGEPHEDMLVKEQLWIQLLTPSINNDFTEDNIHNQHNLEMCFKMKQYALQGRGRWEQDSREENATGPDPASYAIPRALCQRRTYDCNREQGRAKA